MIELCPDVCVEMSETLEPALLTVKRKARCILVCALHTRILLLPSLHRSIKFSSVLLCFNKIPVLLWSRNMWLVSKHSERGPNKERQDRAKVLALRSQL